MTSLDQGTTAVAVAAPRDLWLNAAVLGFFGGLWCGWAQSSPPAGWTAILVVAEVAGIVLAVCCVVTLARHRSGSSRMASAQAHRRYRRVVGVEVALCLAGAVAFGASGHPHYVAAWVLLVVGVHFWPLATMMRMPALAVTAVVETLVAVVAFVLGVAGVADSTFVAGGLGGAVMVVAALVSAAQGRRRVAAVGWQPRLSDN